LKVSSLSNTGGIFFSISSRSSPIIVSDDFPALLDALGCIPNTVSNISYPSFWAVIISALSCRPNTSGSELTGRLFM